MYNNSFLTNNRIYLFVCHTRAFFFWQRHKAGNLRVRGSCKLRGQKKEKNLTKNVYDKNYSTHLAPFLYEKADMRPVPVLSDYLVKLVIPAFRAI